MAISHYVVLVLEKSDFYEMTNYGILVDRSPMTEKDSKPVWRISAASKSKPRNRKRKRVPAAELPDGLSKDNDVAGESLLDVEMDHQDASVYAQTSEELSAMAHQLGCDERSHCDKVN